MDFKKKAFSYLLFCFFLLTIIYFVSADYSVTTNSLANNFTFNEDNNQTYNITINNSETDINSNITQVNISFPTNFTLSLSTNGTNSYSIFSNLGNNLTWENSSGVIFNFTNNSFWINATVTSPGTYNITITLVNGSGVNNYNLTVYINDILGPIISNNTNYSITKSSAIVNWTTNVSSNYTIRYGNYNLSNSSYSLNYSVTLTNLTSATNNYYNITSCDSNNNCNTSTYSVRTESFVMNNSFMNFSDGATATYNFTINNSETDINSNITQINITLPAGINFTVNTQNTSFSNSSFSNLTSTRTLTWSNSSGFILNNTWGYIWFSASSNTNFYGGYNITVTITNSFGTEQTNFSVRIYDDTNPVISNDLVSDPGETSATITWNVSESVNYTLEWGEDGQGYTDETHISSFGSSPFSRTINSLDAETDYDYRITAYDNSGNQDTETGTFTTDPADEDSGSGSGSSTTNSFWLNTESYSDKELSVRGNVNTTLPKAERARVKIDGTRYYIGIIKVSSTSVTINVSDENDLWLQDKYSKGDSKKYEINGDNYYDLEIIVRNLNSTAANITIQYLHESKNSLDRPTFNGTVSLNSSLNQTGSEANNQTGDILGVTSQPLRIVLYILAAVVILLIIGFIINMIGKIKGKGHAQEEDGLIQKVKKEIKAKVAKRRLKVNVKNP